MVWMALSLVWKRMDYNLESFTLECLPCVLQLVFFPPGPFCKPWLSLKHLSQDFFWTGPGGRVCPPHNPSKSTPAEVTFCAPRAGGSGRVVGRPQRWRAAYAWGDADCNSQACKFSPWEISNKARSVLWLLCTFRGRLLLD